MKLPGKSQENIDIADYYAIKPASIWRGLKLEGAAFVWLCIYLFFEYVRPQSLYPAIDFLPWSQISLLLACATAFTDRKIKWVSNTGNFLFILFVIIVVASSLVAFRPSVSFGKIEIIMGWLIFYFLIINVVNTEKRFIVFILVFFFANFKMSQFGTRDFLSGGYNKYGVSGAPGWFRDSGDLGIEMTIFVSLVTAFVLALKQYWGLYKKMFFYLMPLTGLLTIIATSSRGAQLGMVAVGLCFLIVSRKIKVLFGVVIIGAAIYAILPEQMMGEFKEAGEDSTSQARLILWSYGLDVLQDNPFLGVGYHNWIDYCWFTNPNGLEGLNHCLVPHNSYVTVSAETGIIGFTVYMLMMLYIFIENRRTRANANKVSNKFILFSAYGLDGGLIAYMVSTFFFSVTWYPMLYVQFALTVALYTISKKQATDAIEAQRLQVIGESN